MRKNRSVATWRSGSLGRLAVVAVILLLSACGGSDRRRVYPVRGQVLVDGKGADSALVYLHAVEDPDPRVVRPFAEADKNGKFAIATYVSGDGAPPGSYNVTIEWRERSGMFKQDLGGPDRLKGAFADPKNSPFKITVEERDNDLPAFELSTKGKGQK